jgi:predicted aconitase
LIAQSEKGTQLVLTDYEKKMQNGHLGEAVSMAMSILVELGEAIGAPEMVEITHVHTDSGFYLGDAGLEFVEHLAARGAQVAVPTSMNNTSFDIERCRSYGVSAELAAKIKRLEKAHLTMGATPSWTCAPYQDGILPKPGALVAWSESSAIVFANSILGARTNRTGDLVDICCALTGRAPKVGLYLEENRMAAIHAKLKDFPAETFTDARFYPLLGYFIGKQCGNQVVAISGIPKCVTMDDLKGLGAATASSGATALFHIVGITPEAPRIEACLKNDTTTQIIAVTPDALKKTAALLCTAENEQLDWVGLGCPHFSYAEFTELAKCIKGQKINSNIAFSVFTSRKILHWADHSGIVDKLTDAGIEVYADGCLLLYPQSLRPSGTLMTNSAKAANYIFSQSGYRAAYGSISECVESAVAGKIIQRRPAWLQS